VELESILSLQVNSDVLRVFSGSPNPTITRGLGYTPFPSDLFDGIIGEMILRKI